MKNTLLLVYCCVLQITIGYSNLKNVELVYNKSDFTIGKEVFLTLKTTNDRGKVFYSNKNFKYSCNDFLIVVTKGGKLISKSSKGFSIKVYDEISYSSIHVFI